MSITLVPAESHSSLGPVADAARFPPMSGDQSGIFALLKELLGSKRAAFASLARSLRTYGSAVALPALAALRVCRDVEAASLLESLVADTGTSVFEEIHARLLDTAEPELFRIHLVRILSHLDAPLSDKCRALSGALLDSNPYLREEAAGNVANLTTVDEALEQLLRQLAAGDPDPNVRVAAQDALER